MEKTNRAVAARMALRRPDHGPTVVFNLSGENGGYVGPGIETIVPRAALLAERATVESV